MPVYPLLTSDLNGRRREANVNEVMRRRTGDEPRLQFIRI
jgi:hypothetical protein